MAVELAKAAGLVLDDWQADVLVDALAQKADGRWAAREAAVVCPRQNGKGSILEALELAALFLPEPNAPPPLVLHSAHEYKTADEHFRRMRDLVDGADRLREQVRIVRTASGAQAIELHSGARLRFVTRTSGSGRGFSADLIVMDEAYNLSDESMAAVLPTLSARPNPQIWYTSSAGMPSSSVLSRVRARGLAGDDPQLAYFEWSAEDDCDLDDVKAWAQANPALGWRIDIESIAAERAAMPDEQFARERLGLWADASKKNVAVDPETWKTLIGPTPPQGRDVVFALDVAPDHSTATVAAAWSTPDGTWLQLADHRPGVEWIVARCGELLQRWGGRLLVEQTGTAAFLLPKLTADAVSRRFYADACSTLDAAVTSRSLRHGNQRELNDATVAARWSSSGEAGQRVLSRKDPQVSPLVAAALALHGLSGSPKRPGSFLTF